MKLKVSDTKKFMEVIQSCEGNVYLTDYTGGDEFKLNIKSELSMYVGVGKLLDKYGDWFEIYAMNKEDEAKIMEFMKEM